jgi:hypothetical protein
MSSNIEEEIKGLQDKIKELKLLLPKEKRDLLDIYHINLNAENQRKHARNYYTNNRDKILEYQKDKYKNNEEFRNKRKEKYQREKNTILLKRKEDYLKKKNEIEEKNVVNN